MGYRQIDHTADLALEIWAGSEEQLLEEAARAVVALVTEDEAGTGDERRRIRLEALDPGDRLVRWLNEIVHLAVAEGFLVGSAEVSLDGPGGLRADLRGRARAFDGLRGEVKAVTYHGLRLDREGDRWRAVVVIDV
jgi:SHS2 domain-containing protein